ncbi:hypothetical protein PQQ86_39050 [Paraburkholderia sediminicola]|uniref:hypothetical protein n=1 Tax=Paraburkholderia sediminicola TaxID=458836 RepID=UPI0038B72165
MHPFKIKRVSRVRHASASTQPPTGQQTPAPLRTILDVVDELLPRGTRTGVPVGSGANPMLDRMARLGLCPQWPADVFAVAATLMDLTGCYAEASLVDGDFRRHGSYLVEVIDAAKAWRKSGDCPAVVEKWWEDLLVVHGSKGLGSIGAPETGFCPVVSLLMRLLAVADEASEGVGWLPRAGVSGELSVVVERAAASFIDRAVVAPDPVATLPHVPLSLCEMVPPDKATVLPKSLTPSVGCTIRSMSHYLALLPPASVVESQWVLPDNGPSTDTMRLLVIPYPFRVDDESFVASGPQRDLGSKATMQPYFALSPTWLEQPKPVTADMLRNDLIAPLVAAAEKKFGARTIDGVLFPECALSAGLAEELLAVLAARPIPGLKFLITGTVLAGAPGSDVADGQPGRNLAKTMLFADGPASGEEAVVWDDSHSKHHRWALDDAQVKRYGLTGISAPDKAKVWEHIAVGQRKLPFLALRDDLCMTVLICEDLARADPAMPVVRAVGPNLVVALLMDGPQLSSRWPGRYATVLAEDPGSSVLSITSAGMVDRSNLTERSPARAVGLWRHERGYNTELYLPSGHHGLVLTVRADKDEQFSLDHRSDQKATRRWTLDSVTPLAVKADWF